MNEAENWKGLPLEARNETKNILRKDILERYLEIKNTGLKFKTLNPLKGPECSNTDLKSIFQKLTDCLNN